MTAPVIRPMTAADMKAATEFMMHLGYDIPVPELARRFEITDAAEGHAVFIAETDGEVLGLLHVFDRPALEKPPEAIVQSLAIHEKEQCRGIGRRLMERAEAWAADRGLASVALHTQVYRDRARTFYARLGYEDAAEAKLMRKSLLR
ncbi:MAG: GNAT family N-acetyltransferase [Rhodospirillaceae bacterium]